MLTKDFIHKKLPLLIFILAFLLFIMSLVGNGNGTDTNTVAHKTADRLRQRMEILDMFILKARDFDECNLLKMDIPEDMVIYRYVNDSLQSWCNQFSIINDDIARRMVFERISDLNNRIVSPLTDVTEDYRYLNLGPKWFVVKKITGDNNDTYIAGIEIMNTLIDDLHKTENGVNTALNLAECYSVVPLSYGNGSPVEIDGRPLFNIVLDTSVSNPFFEDSELRWLALGLLILASMLFLAGHRTLKAYALVMILLFVLLAVSYMWGFQMNMSSELFSPTLYADGGFLFSLGALLVVNTFIFLFNLSTFYIKNRLLSLIRNHRRDRKRHMFIWGVMTLTCFIMTFVYTNATLQSLIMNSNISLGFHRWDNNSVYTILVYISYTGLLACLLMQIQFFRPAVTEFFGVRYNIFSPGKLAVAAMLFSLYFTYTANIIGFRKEEDRVLVWANRLAVERDLGLEIRLRNVEEAIASDQLISTLTTIENGSGIILNRLSEYYMSRIRQDYNFTVIVLGEHDRDTYFNNILHGGTRIADGSRFFFMKDANGHSHYSGLFLFYNRNVGVTRMILRVESNSNREDRGYYSLMGRFSNPGDINIPSNYSYAKYDNERLMSYKGNYAYPTIFDREDWGDPAGFNAKVTRKNGYIHFVHRISDEEMIVISRERRNAMVYFTSFSYLFLALAGVLYLSTRKKNDKKRIFKSNFFRIRINAIIFTCSTLILVSLTVISVLFVYKRNENNMYNLMSSKISTIQAMIENRARLAVRWQDMNTQEFTGILENIGNSTKTDITLYTPDGKVFRSTTPEVFEKMILGSRIDQKAFDNIIFHHQRYYIHREKIDGYSYWAMYAPVFNDNREIIAIICAPYTDSSYDFRREAVFHTALILNLFLLLLIGSLIFSTREVNNLFAPLIEMGRKMNSADINSLEYIVYKREDEISSLVDAYNRMVHDLSDSTRQLAQAERDKAWSQMARQVAHEIKNPLTPIKLEIQRLIRLKQKGDPAWEEKFDKVSSVVLEHIDILTDTANEFSTFAKLYSEDPVLMDLDKTLKDQILIFDNKENVKISYIGMENAFVSAPKPQLIRVFVNLITNAIQAVEILQKEARDKGEEVPVGKVLICLRNSTREDCYDIVFDDNGPGVAEDHQCRLFTPNFTTKSSGTGLGLAICRNIIEKCNGEISYRKSYSLGGASFIVTLPKNTEK